MRYRIISILFMIMLAAPAGATGYQDFNAAVAARNREDNEAAIASFTRALGDADLPQHLTAPAHLGRAEEYLAKKKFDEAIGDFTSVLSLRPDDILAHIGRGLAYAYKEQFDKAIADDEDVVRLKPYYFNGYSQLADRYTEAKRFDDAIKIETSMIGLRPGTIALYIRRAYSYRDHGSPDLAVADANKAIDIDSDSAAAYVIRAYARLDKGTNDDAIEDAGQVVRKAPKSFTAYLTKGFIEWEAGRPDYARASFEKATQLNPSDSASALWLAIASMKDGGGDSNLSERARSFDLVKWPGPLVNYYLGKTTAEDVLKSARNENAIAQRDQLCVANFYIAEWDMVHQDATKAKTAFQDAAANCPAKLAERSAAAAELKHLP